MYFGGALVPNYAENDEIWQQTASKLIVLRLKEIKGSKISLTSIGRKNLMILLLHLELCRYSGTIEVHLTQTF